jgi:hypothetical protein
MVCKDEDVSSVLLNAVWAGSACAVRYIAAGLTRQQGGLVLGDVHPVKRLQARLAFLLPAQGRLVQSCPPPVVYKPREELSTCQTTQQLLTNV